MKTAIIGGTGFLGKALAAEWQGGEVVLAGSRDIDIRSPQSVQQFFERHQPQRVLLAAAYSDVDGCERDHERAEAVNHRGAVNVAEACREHGARLMFISTDYVFDGAANWPYEVTDPVAPVNFYGRTKVEAEQAIRVLLPDACIARTSWIFGAEGKCFPNAVLDLVASGQKGVRAIVDQHGIPNYNHDIARALIALLDAQATGTVHVTNPGVTSWYEFARELLPAAGLAQVTVEPIRVEDLGRQATRPRYSAMSDASLREYGIHLPHWRESLADYLERRNLMSAEALRANCG